LRGLADSSCGCGSVESMRLDSRARSESVAKLVCLHRTQDVVRRDKDCQRPPRPVPIRPSGDFHGRSCRWDASIC